MLTFTPHTHLEVVCVVPQRVVPFQALCAIMRGHRLDFPVLLDECCPPCVCLHGATDENNHLVMRIATQSPFREP